MSEGFRERARRVRALLLGPESSGKTTLATHCLAEAQKLGGTCAFIDAEHAFDPSYAEKLGVDPLAWPFFWPLARSIVVGWLGRRARVSPP